MTEDGITSYGIGGVSQALQTEASAKERKKLARRAACLRRKAGIAKLLGNAKRESELLAQAEGCQAQARRFA